MGKLRRALPPLPMIGAIVVAFSVMMLLTVWYSPDCRSHPSINIGEVVLLCRPRGRAMNALMS